MNQSKMWSRRRFVDFFLSSCQPLQVSESGPLSPPESEPPQHSKAEVIDLLTKLSKLLSKQDKFEKATQTAKKVLLRVRLHIFSLLSTS